MSKELGHEKISIERIERFQSLQAGQYWRAIKDCPNDPIKVGTTLLIKSIRFADDAMHTVILRAHPSIYDQYIGFTDGNGRESQKRFTEHRFLINDFIAYFEHEPNYERIRQDEVNAIMHKVGEKQALLAESSVNPKIVDDYVKKTMEEEAQSSKSTTNLPTISGSVEYSPEIVSAVTGSLSSAIGTGVTEQRINEMKSAVMREHRIATIKATWLKERAEELSDLISSMTPYFQEQAEAALAATEDARNHADSLLEGIKSLDLYVGKNVSVEVVKKGASAPFEEPLTVMQKKLFIDEELSVWADVDSWFDHSRISNFFNILSKNESLVNQIFASPRCIVLMATTARQIDYGNAYSNIALNKRNQDVMLMVRDGENIYCVQSPVESHVNAGYLFPSKDEVDGLFKGFDGSNINFSSLKYTDSLKKHEINALHYKRFLILCCGLDHREKLFGDFYPSHEFSNFVSMNFQEKYFRFIHDGDGTNMMPQNHLPPLSEFLKSKNKFLRSGSRVFCTWRELFCIGTAPTSYKEESFHPYRMVRVNSPVNNYGIEVAYLRKGELCVNARVKRDEYSSKKTGTFDCDVYLERYKGDTVGYLCLDMVTHEELQYYVDSRQVRGDFLSYMHFFKLAIKHLKAESDRESNARNYLSQCIMDGQIACAKEDADNLVSRAVAAWRAANRGDNFPTIDEIKSSMKVYNELFEMIYKLSEKTEHNSDEIINKLSSAGHKVIRVAVGKGAKYIAYVEPKNEEMDQRLCDHSWVHKVTLTNKKTGLVEISRAWSELPKATASEVILFADNDLTSMWSNKKHIFKKHSQKNDTIEKIYNGKSIIESFYSPNKDEEKAEFVIDQFMRAYRSLKQKKKYLNDCIPALFIPFGIYLSGNEPFYIGVSTRQIPGLIKLLVDEIKWNNFMEDIACKFNYSRQNEVKEFLNRPLEWNLSSISCSGLKAINDTLLVSPDGVFPRYIDENELFNPMLKIQFEVFKEKNKTTKKFNSAIFDTNFVNDQGEFIADSLLGLKPRQDINPVTVLFYETSFRRVMKESITHCFCDVYQGNKDSGDPDTFWKDTSFSTSSKGIVSRKYISIEAAMEGIEEEAKRTNCLLTTEGNSEVPASTPESGFKRYFLVNKESPAL